jgi:hypothetical protein
MRRECACESGVGRKVGSKAILLVIGGGSTPEPFKGLRKSLDDGAVLGLWALAPVARAVGGGVWLCEEFPSGLGTDATLSGVTVLLWIWLWI